jgi:hypothetical protein
MNNTHEERQYIKCWKKYLDNPEICTSKFPGKYCIEFRNYKSAEFFNSIETCKKFMDCEYYPPSIIVKKDRDWDTLELDEREFYNCYPKYYGSSEISVCMGKKFIRNSKPSFPFLIQDRILSKFENDGESVFILYVKKNNCITAYYAPTTIENKSNLLECLCYIQKYIIPKFDAKNYSEIEYFLTQFDVVEDNNDKFWIKGINWDPKLLDNENKIIDDILHHMNNLEFNYFLPLCLEKLVQTHFSNSSF